MIHEFVLYFMFSMKMMVCRCSEWKDVSLGGVILFILQLAAMWLFIFNYQHQNGTPPIHNNENDNKQKTME